MTRAEAIDYIEKWKTDYSVDAKDREVLSMAIKALEQQPCDDCISRADVLALAEKGTLVSNGNYKSVCKTINELPPVMPKALEQTDGDCISRESVLDIINFEDEWLHDANSHNADTKIAFSTIKSKISEMPSVTPKTEWIPVSERLPEEYLCDDGYVEPSGYVLVWGDHGNYGVSRYWGNRRSKSESTTTYKDWMDLDWVVQKPIAWMPLPQPYKAESEDKE